MSSKVGGLAPIIFDDNKWELENYYYVFTINDKFRDISNGNSFSMFIAKDFSVFNDDSNYPISKIKCILHSYSKYGSEKILSHPTLSEIYLKEVEGKDNEIEKFIVKVGGNPVLVQNEPVQIEQVEKNGGQYFLQFDENGFDADDIRQDYMFGYGAMYAFAVFGSEYVDSVIPGIIQF